MNIAGLSKAKVLAALYNNSKPLGMGFMHFEAANMTEKEAEEQIKRIETQKCGLYFDYLKGRVMKIHLDKDEVDTGLYNRDNGKDAAERVIANLRVDEKAPE